MTARENMATPYISKKRPTMFLLIAVWFALLTGLGEVLILAGGKFLLAKYIHKSPHVVWMAPVADLIIFAIPGLILFLMAWRWPKLVSLRTVAFVFAFLGFLSLLLMVPRLGGYAALVLAAGLAVQSARVIKAHAQGFRSLVNHSLMWMVIIVAGLMISLFAYRLISERRALAKLPPVSADAPNVLLIVLDTVRARNLSLYGYHRPTTPQLARFAENGVRFTRALSTAPWTLPSHASMFTGRYHHELSVNWSTPLDDTYPTLAEALSSQGYLTAGFVANTLFCDNQSGLSRGFAHYEDFLITPGQIIESSSLGKTLTENQWLRSVISNHQRLGRKTAPQVNDDFLGWLSRKDQRPFFAFLNYLDAHEPYMPPEPYDLKFTSKRPSNPELQDEYKYSPEEIRQLMDAYDGSIAYLDHHLGLLFDELENRGLLKNTLVIITSDHGEEFGEHGLMSHGNSLYLSSLHVPLLIAFPSQVPAGKSVDEPVTIRDIPATVVNLLKFENDSSFPGKSLARYWDDTRTSTGEPDQLLSEVNRVPNVPEWFPVAKGNMKSMIVGDMHYIKNGDGHEELYDIENDRDEKYNLAHTDQGSQTCNRFRTSLEMVLASKRGAD